MPGLLTQPIARTRLFLVKVVPLALLLTVLSVAVVLLFGVDPIAGGPRTSVIFWLPLAAGLCLAPLMAMVTRGTLAGAVLSVGLPLLLFPVGAYVGLPNEATLPVIAVLACVCAVLTWRTFLHLEVATGPQAEVDLTAWLRLRPSAEGVGGRGRVRRPRTPLWRLVRKELRLHQLAFLVSGMFVVLWFAMSGGRALPPDSVPHAIMRFAGVLQTVLVPIMIGALALAEERRLGTVELEALLPIAVRTQWAVKVGVTAGLVVLLSIVLPTLVFNLAPVPDFSSVVTLEAQVFGWAAALYVSSISTSGVRALLATFPAIAVGWLSWFLTLEVVGPTIQTALGQVRAAFGVIAVSRVEYMAWLWGLLWWFGAGLVVVLLGLAYANYRTADRSSRRQWRQVLWLLAYAAFASLALGLYQAVVIVSHRG